MLIYTQGTFDLFHIGHLNLLKRCAKLGDVIVALLSDKAILKYRGHKPVIPFEERKKIIESLSCVSKVIKSDNLHTKKEILKYKPDFVVVGTDWVGKDLAKQYGVTKKWLDTYLLYFPYTDTTSSTKIKERIKYDTV